MQQERNYFRRLKGLIHDIYELCISARRAYISIPPAVKTSRPQKWNCKFNAKSSKINFIFNVLTFCTYYSLRISGEDHGRYKPLWYND